MDKIAAKVMLAVWRHSGHKGNVWTPQIDDIESKNPRFREGNPRSSVRLVKDDLHDDTDWYWTPAVSSGGRKADQYPAQRVLWVDCDKGYDKKALKRLSPNFVWETSPGHLQAVWLMEDYIEPHEYGRDGLMGLLAQCIGADPSGVDIGQLLRVPTTVHHKRKPYRGRLLRTCTEPVGRSKLLNKIYRECGFKPATAALMAREEPEGDRSKQLWRFAREAAENGIDEALACKALRASKWNKWQDRDPLLREDVAKAYREHANRPQLTATLTETVSATPQMNTQRLDVVASQTSPTRWLVPGVIPEMGCGLWIAPPKVGKTRTALEVALGLATGVSPLGIPINERVPVAFLSLEDGPELTIERLGDLLNRDEDRKYYHWNGYIDEGLMWYPPESIPLQLGFDALDLSKPEGLMNLQEIIETHNLRLCVIDTLSMAIGKASINDSSEMYSILKNVKNIAKSTGCSVVFIHHTRKRNFESGETIQEKVLGSTALHAWADYVAWLTPPKDPHSEVLHFGVQTKRHTREHLVDRESLVILRDEPDLPDPDDPDDPPAKADPPKPPKTPPTGDLIAQYERTNHRGKVPRGIAKERTNNETHKPDKGNSASSVVPRGRSSDRASAGTGLSGDSPPNQDNQVQRSSRRRSDRSTKPDRDSDRVSAPRVRGGSVHRKQRGSRKVPLSGGPAVPG